MKQLPIGVTAGAVLTLLGGLTLVTAYADVGTLLAVFGAVRALTENLPFTLGLAFIALAFVIGGIGTYITEVKRNPCSTHA